MMEPILKDLCALIRKSTIHYNETYEQKDVILTEEFQELYGEYLRSNNYGVDFYKYTAVITTPIGNYMFVPNQWFVIASYAVGVYTELMQYKKYLMQVCEYMGEKPKLFVPKMRDDSYYVAGDTDSNEDVKKVKCDVALVPIGGHYTMDKKQAVDLICGMKPKAVIPTHYGELVGSPSDGNDFKDYIDIKDNNIQVELKL